MPNAISLHPYDPDDRWCLAFDAAQIHNVTVDSFWTPTAGINLSNFFCYECWARVDANGYIFSAGFGGAHEMLFGPGNLPGALTGNIRTSAGTISFSGDYRLQPGQWAHLAVLCDGNTTEGGGGNLFTAVDGVPDGWVAWELPAGTPAQRVTVGAVGGSGALYIGGSDHIMFTGRIAALRVADDWMPYNQPLIGFQPHRQFFPWGTKSSGEPIPYDLLLEFTRPDGVMIADKSPGRKKVGDAGDTARYRHPGVRWNAQHGLVNDYLPRAYYGLQSGPLPRWVRDPDGPYQRGYDITPAPAASVPAATNPPRGTAGLLAWDSVGRADQTLAWKLPIVGSNIGTAAKLDVGAVEQGVKAGTPWTVLSGQYCISQGRLVGIGNGPHILAVDAGAADHEVSVMRKLSPTSRDPRTECGVYLRGVDKQNYLCVTQSRTPASGNSQLHVQAVQAGVIGGYLANYNPTSTLAWTYLRAWAKGNVLRIYIGDGASAWTQQGADIDITGLPNGTLAGILSSPYASVETGFQQMKNVAVYGT